MTTISATMIRDSISNDGVRLSTLELRYPRPIHSELMTHRVFSRNASSSRAIPVKKLIRDVIADPFIPLVFGLNKPGMQSDQEATGLRLFAAKAVWLLAMYLVVGLAWVMTALGIHKQFVNRMLEPWAHITVVVTATEWENFFRLRRHKDAEPHIHMLADAIWNALEASEPTLLHSGEWHLPYVLPEEEQRLSVNTLKDISAARCARTSYLTHDGRVPQLEKDIALCARLINADVFHASPFEHQASPDVKRFTAVTLGRVPEAQWSNAALHGNFVGWIQNRRQLEIRYAR